MLIDSINTNDFNYFLPEDKIAKYPEKERDCSKLLVYNQGDIQSTQFSSIPNFLDNNDFLVFNDTKVVQARLIFKKMTGAEIEIFLLEPIEPQDYALMFESKTGCKWKCIIGNAKKWKTGTLELVIETENTKIGLFARKIETNQDSSIIEFSWNHQAVTFREIMDKAGQTPIPPYLKRDSEEIDKKRYQTVYSKYDGSVAAPTAGLHFTNDVLKKLNSKGILTDSITLHVGAGTFKPVKSDTVFEHDMHTEHFIVSKHFIDKLLQNIEHVTAVGTTTVRTLESLYWLGYNLEKNIEHQKFHITQWETYHKKDLISVRQSLINVSDYLERNGIEQLSASTCIMIVPGYQFRIVKKLITNFHQPKSTLLLLIAAFIGSSWKKVYDYALKNNFRFLSYGDSSLLIP